MALPKKAPGMIQLRYYPSSEIHQVVCDSTCTVPGVCCILFYSFIVGNDIKTVKARLRIFTYNTYPENLRVKAVNAQQCFYFQ